MQIAIRLKNSGMADEAEARYDEIVLLSGKIVSLPDQAERGG